jgi:hypothetical protein
LRQTGEWCDASFVSLIQRLNQFLNQRTQLPVVTFIGHRNTKFAPIFCVPSAIFTSDIPVRMLLWQEACFEPRR